MNLFKFCDKNDKVLKCPKKISVNRVIFVYADSRRPNIGRIRYEDGFQLFVHFLIIQANIQMCQSILMCQESMAVTTGIYPDFFFSDII